ncbi:MAG: type II toxin-antitoxin system RelE/ParE family toxin [Candidatus Hydrogenedentes bacterium]|nr:type II toxin-antitoxin system RelE/ParE family toxin [Candidatus Hydrogenedentota bacterium]
MKRYRVIFRREARDEAIETVAYLAEHSGLEVAAQWLTALESALESLSRWPRRCPIAREAAAFEGVELRQRYIKSHRIVFIIDGEEVHVLHVLHGARKEFGAGD